MKIYSNFLRRNLLDLKSKLPYIRTELTQIRFDQYDDTEQFSKPLDYHTARFCSFLFDKNHLNLDGANDFEKQEINKAVTELKEFKELDHFMNYCKGVSFMVENIKRLLQIQQATSNVSTYNEETEKELIEKLEETFKVYLDLLKEAEQYPDWVEKIKSEIGQNWAFIYNMHRYSEELEKLFEKNGFDRYFFFK